MLLFLLAGKDFFFFFGGCLQCSQTAEGIFASILPKLIALGHNQIWKK